MTRAFRVAAALGAMTILIAPRALAQAATPNPFGIVDNSFIVEEAFNQDRGVVQTMLQAFRFSDDGRVESTVTQEWPLGGPRHQFSYVIPFVTFNPAHGLGDIPINYRFQLATEGARLPAMAPRLTIILPTATRLLRDEDDAVGWEVNLPASKRFGYLYVHGNIGTTHVLGETTPFGGASAIVAVRPMLNAMVESIFRPDSVTLSPGVRFGWNIGDRQFVVGVGAPVTWRDDDHSTAALMYVSWEAPFTKNR